jgi:thiamine-phosphate pyrophosphorylase
MADRRAKLAAMRVYALLTEQHCRRPWQETAELLLAGGADVIQLREKALPDRELLARARVIRKLTEESGALFIVNDRPDVAVICGADGVHVGQEDLPPQEVRRLVGPEMLVGLSTHSAEQARLAESEPVDYIGVGPFAPTTTKGYSQGKGEELVRAVCAVTHLPAFAIGGIVAYNAPAAIEAGAQAVAACLGLCGAPDTLEATRQLRAAVEQAMRRRSGQA